MVADEALRWTLAVLLLAATLYSACRAVAASWTADRVGSALHAFMTAAMALMLVPGSQWPLLPQLLLFVVGTWWFILQAVSRRAHTRDGQRAVSRAKPAYDAASMAAMVFMLAAAGVWEAPPSGVLPAAPGLAPHHGVAPALPPAAPVHDWSTQPTLVLTVASALAVVFGLASALWAVRLLLQLRPGFRGRLAPAAIRSDGGDLRGRRRAGFRDVADAAVEVVGAAAFALMFAALAA